jgi:hypothetical protein
MGEGGRVGRWKGKREEGGWVGGRERGREGGEESKHSWSDDVFPAHL